MSKKAKGDRIQVILECTEQKASGVPGCTDTRACRVAETGERTSKRAVWVSTVALGESAVSAQNTTTPTNMAAAASHTQREELDVTRRLVP